MTKTRPFLSTCYGYPSTTEVPPCPVAVASGTALQWPVQCQCAASVNQRRVRSSRGAPHCETILGCQYNISIQLTATHTPTVKCHSDDNMLNKLELQHYCISQIDSVEFVAKPKQIITEVGSSPCRENGAKEIGFATLWLILLSQIIQRYCTGH